MMHDNPGGARVLVVDDDALILELVTTRLSLAVGTRNSERLDARFMTPFDAH